MGGSTWGSMGTLVAPLVAPSEMPKTHEGGECGVGVHEVRPSARPSVRPPVRRCVRPSVRAVARPPVVPWGPWVVRRGPVRAVGLPWGSRGRFLNKELYQNNQ